METGTHVTGLHGSTLGQLSGLPVLDVQPLPYMLCRTASHRG